jgi:hypothetical protein
LLQPWQLATASGVAKVLDEDVPAWQHIVERQSHLQSSTLGNLIAILSKYNIREEDLSYLKWVKEKRDFFIRFFNNFNWPGDLPSEAIVVQCRRLRFSEYVYTRASRRIYKIFSRAGLVEYIDLGGDGALIANIGALESEPDWLKDFAVAAVRYRASTRRNRGN